ncbi:MAG: SMP-30/gluconolactonase/LRE family protein [Fimbriiglobus sp.]
MIRTLIAEPWHVPGRERDRFLPEGPRLWHWDGRPVLVWVNIQESPTATSGSFQWKFLPDGEAGFLHFDDRPGFWVPVGDRWLVGAGKQLVSMDPITGESEVVAVIPDDHPRTIINDGEPLPDGSGVVFGTKDTAFQEAIGHLYLYTHADRQLTTLLPQQTCSNGKFLRPSAEGFYLWDIDTPTKQVRQYRLNMSTRSLHFERIALDLTHREDYPDGMIAHGESAIIAFYHPGDVPHGQACIFDLDHGELTATIQTPGSPRVTCPALIDGTLYLTTADEGMPESLRAKHPYAGALFRATIVEI